MSRYDFDNDPWDRPSIVPATRGGAPRRTLSKREIVFARTTGLCAYGCRHAATTLDHVVPKSRGGSNDADNLVASCERCNTSKGNKLLHEWRPGLVLVRGRIVRVRRDDATG